MITEAIANVFYGALDFILNSLPGLYMTVPLGFSQSMSEMLAAVAYFLPLDVLLPFLSMSIALDVIRIITRAIWRLKSFIPLMGN